MGIEERKRELDSTYKLKTKEIIGSIKRLRNDNHMEIETLNRTINFLKNENELIANKYRNEEKRCNDFRNELNKNRKQFDLSSIGQLQIENNKLQNKIDELTDKLTDRGNEIIKWEERYDANEKLIRQLRGEMVANEKQAIVKEKKQMEKLKARIDDQITLQTIKE